MWDLFAIDPFSLWDLTNGRNHLYERPRILSYLWRFSKTDFSGSKCLSFTICLCFPYFVFVQIEGWLFVLLLQIYDSPTIAKGRIQTSFLFAFEEIEQTLASAKIGGVKTFTISWKHNDMHNLIIKVWSLFKSALRSPLYWFCCQWPFAMLRSRASKTILRYYISVPLLADRWCFWFVLWVPRFHWTHISLSDFWDSQLICW